MWTGYLRNPTSSRPWIIENWAGVRAKVGKDEAGSLIGSFETWEVDVLEDVGVAADFSWYDELDEADADESVG